MKLSVIIFVFISFLLPVKAQIQSGSFRIDGNLRQINVSANADFGRFRTEMSVGYNVEEKKIDYYHAELKMEPADIYFALEVSKACHRSVDDVIDVYRVHKASGWGEIAKQLGIKPGSPEFHALKKNANKKAGNGPRNDEGPGNGNGRGNGRGHGHGNGHGNK